MLSFPLAFLGWEFFEPRRQQWLAAWVPGCVHLDLRCHELIPDPFYGSNELDLQWIEREDWHYRASFDLPADSPLFAHDTVELAADGLDTTDKDSTASPGSYRVAGKGASVARSTVSVSVTNSWYQARCADQAWQARQAVCSHALPQSGHTPAVSNVFHSQRQVHHQREDSRGSQSHLGQ